MSDDLSALAHHLVMLPGVRDALRFAEDPSASAIILLALVAMAIGRAMTFGGISARD